MKHYSTAQAAAMIGVHKVTLKRWLLDGKVSEPLRMKTNGIEIRIWTDADVERVLKFKKKNYRKGRGRKPKPKR